MIFKLITKAVVLVVALGASLASQATVIDFTDDAWEAAISGASASIGDVTLTSSTGELSFNANDNGGCVAGISSHGLACDGDGIGINNDEITEGGYQVLSVSFSSAVNILNVDVLDLFGSERDGETALIMQAGGSEQQYTPSPENDGVAGGFWSTGFNANGVTELFLYSPDDGFSDYALARIEFEAIQVPEPGSIALLFFGVIAIAALRQRKIA